jgi:hypothetical protein
MEAAAAAADAGSLPSATCARRRPPVPPPPPDKDRLRSVADVVMVLVDTMVKQSEKKLSDSAATLQAILAAAADENGEWYLPLSQQQVCVCGGVGVGGAGRGQRPAAAWWSSAWRTPWAGPWRRRCSRLAPKRRRGQSGSWDQPEAALGPALLDGGCLGAGGAAGGEGAAGGGCRPPLEYLGPPGPACRRVPSPRARAPRAGGHGAGGARPQRRGARRGAAVQRICLHQEGVGRPL